MMKQFIPACFGLILLSISPSFASEPIDINTMSLEKTSPFDTPTPKPFEMNAGQYRETPLGAPAMIPHSIASYPITKERNSCLMCHGNPEKITAPKTPGSPSAMPKTHWAEFEGTLKMHPSRHECLLCHAPQADVKPLVPTTH